MIKTTVNRRTTGFSYTERKCIYEMAQASRKIFNASADLVEKHYKDTGEHLGKYSLDSAIRESVPEYRELMSAVSRETIYSVSAGYQTFFSLLKNGRKDARPPRSSEERPLYPVAYPQNAFSVKDGVAVLSIQKKAKEKYGIKGIRVKLPRHLISADIRTIKLLPREDGSIDIAFSYKCEDAAAKLPKDNVLCIDLGVNNFCACVDNLGGRPFLVSGARIKDILYTYDTQMAKYKPLARRTSERGETKRIKSLIEKKDNSLKYELHAISNYIISYAQSRNIGKIVVGVPSPDRYAELNEARRDNKLGSQFPYGKFIEYLSYKSKAAGITLSEVDEAFTSKCDALACEQISFHDEYLGERVARGLFQSSTGAAINADINAAINIMRIATKGDQCVENLSGSLSRPRKVRPDEYHKMQRCV